jgi:NADPH:quinone reductase-like Zn-dependent oxidoreductase
LHFSHSTGFIGIELAKAYGAANIVTAATGPAGIAFVKSLGATTVVDYKKEVISHCIALQQ